MKDKEGNTLLHLLVRLGATYEVWREGGGLFPYFYFFVFNFNFN